MASAAPTSTFFGSHPRRAQVPPNGLESTIATFHPASRQRDVTPEAADPVPIAIKSNLLVIVSSRHLVIHRAQSCDSQRFTPGQGRACQDTEKSCKAASFVGWNTCRFL